MTRLLPPALILLGLAACAKPEPELLSSFYEHEGGVVRICYDEKATTPEQVWRMADDVCKQYQRTAKFYVQQRFQCDWQTPTLITYHCVARPGERPPPFNPHRAPLRRDINS